MGRGLQGRLAGQRKWNLMICPQPGLRAAPAFQSPLPLRQADPDLGGCETWEMGHPQFSFDHGISLSCPQTTGVNAMDPSRQSIGD